MLIIIYLIHGKMQNILGWFIILIIIDPVHDQVPGDADDAVTLDHVEPCHHQVVAVCQMSQSGCTSQQS